MSSPPDYEETLVEIKFPKRFGILVSRERVEAEEDWDVSIHSFAAEAAENFYAARHRDDAKVSWIELRAALDSAAARLRASSKLPPEEDGR